MTSPRDRDIKNQYLSGTSICVLAAEHGVSRQRIYQIVRSQGAYRTKLSLTQGLKPGSQRWRVEQRSLGLLRDRRHDMRGATPEILRLREAGWGYGAICEELDVTEATVSKCLASHAPEMMVIGRRG